MKNALKKLVVGLVVAVLGCAAFAVTYTNRIGQVVVVGTNGVVTSVTDPNVADGSFRTNAPPGGVIISTNTTVSTGSYGIPDIGWFLVGTVSGRVYIATSYTNWTQLN